VRESISQQLHNNWLAASFKGARSERWAEHPSGQAFPTQLSHHFSLAMPEVKQACHLIRGVLRNQVQNSKRLFA